MAAQVVARWLPEGTRPWFRDPISGPLGRPDGRPAVQAGADTVVPYARTAAEHAGRGDSPHRRALAAQLSRQAADGLFQALAA